jgi:hypothetical protein
MDIGIKSLGIVFAVIGIVFLLRPDVMKWLMEFFKKGKRIYLAGLLRFVLGVIFLLGARDCVSKPIIAALGILFLISALLIFTLRLEKLKSMIDWYQKRTLLLLRVMAIITLAIGAIIIYSA